MRAELESRWIAARRANEAFVAQFALATLEGATSVIGFAAHPVRDARGAVISYFAT
ncbi:MAG: hypothetical protein EBV41_07095, partial [Actinobacteria bacterium]|nr:hypothetical protein [Actinomycetota bacterium]